MTMHMDWILKCSNCSNTRGPEGLPTVCDACGLPWLVHYPDRPPPPLQARAEVRRGHGMWKYRPFMPLAPGEVPVSLGEGDTPLLSVPHIAKRLGIKELLVKDEGCNPTGSFKSRGLSAAITRAVAAGATKFVIPTAGNAGVAAAAYCARAGVTLRVYAPQTTPATILSQIRYFGADLQLLDGHIGDCGKAGRAWAAETNAFDLSTLREPYRIEGKKTLGLELAMQLNWHLPDVIIYPTGGGTGLIGMWKAFEELRTWGWVTDEPPRMVTVQSTDCAPIVKAFKEDAAKAEAWPEPWTVASGLRVPGPLGDRLILSALKLSRGTALAVSDEELMEETERGTKDEGIDFAPEGGAALAAVRQLLAKGFLTPESRVVVFNTGAGWLYR
jgi:threonine synthase